MRKRVKWIAVLWMAAAMVFQMTACSEKEAAAGEAGSGQEITDGSEETIKITVQSWQYALGEYKGFIDDDDQAAAIADEFNATHPGIEVEVILMRQEDHLNALKVDLAAGNAPDVIGIVPGGTLEQFSSQLEPLAPYAVEEWGEDWMDRYVESAFTMVKMSGEEIYAFPSAMSAAGTIWYNSSMLAEAGVDMFPESWEDLKEAAGSLRENGSIPLMFGGKDEWQNHDMFLTILGTINRELTEKVFALEADWEQEDVIKAFEYYQKLYTDGIVQDGALATTIYNEGYSQWRDDDGNCTLPMIFNGSWDLGSLRSNNSYYEHFSSYGIGAAVFPAIEGNEGAILTAPDVAWAVNSSSEQKAAAWEFVRWLCDDMQQDVVDSLAFFSVLSDAPALTVETNEHYQAAYDVIAQALAGGNTVGFRESFYADMSTALFHNLQLLATSGCTPQEAARAMDVACSALK